MLVLPIAVGALLLGAARLQNLTEPRHAKVDLASVLLSAVAFGGIVYGLSRFGEASHAAGGLVGAWTPLVAGAAALSLFVARQIWLQRTDAALLDLRTFTSPVFSVAVVLMGLSMLALFGTLILLPYYTQNVLGLEPLATGLLVLPGGVLMGVLAPGVGRAYDRVGARPLLVPGAVLVSGAVWGMTTLDERSAPWLVLALHVVLSLGLALTFTPLFTSSLGSLPARLYSHGSAVVGTVQQVAGAAGTALFVTVMTAGALAASGGSGPQDASAVAAGVRDAFLVGAVLTLLAIPAAFAVRTPAGAAPPAVGH